MQIKLFTIPVFGSDSIEEEMNRFLRGHRILQLERHFCADNGGYWAILIGYVDGDPLAEVPPASRRERKDFSEGMTEEEKLRFGHFKAIRKQLADQKSRHRGTGVLCGYADLMMEKLIPVRRTSCRILAPYSFASLMISSLRSRLYVSRCAWHRVTFN